MRERKVNRRSEWRDRKRAALRIVLLATAPMMAIPARAESPPSQFVLPPLPLVGHADQAVSLPTINLFCQPAPIPTTATVRKLAVAVPTLGYPRAVSNQFFVVPNSGVQLASGDAAETTFRLVPLDSQPSADTAKESSAGVVRSNPMIISEPVAEPAGVKASPKTVTSKSETTTTVVKEGAVSFSLNDDKLVDTTTQSIETTVETRSMATLLRGDGAPLASAPPVVLAPVKGVIQYGKAGANSAAVAVKPAKPYEVDSTAEIKRGSSSSRTLLVPLPAADDTRSIAASRAADARIVKGVRPRVDVGLPSMAIERVSSADSTDSAAVVSVSPVVAAKSPTELTFESVESTSLTLKRAEVRPLNFNGQVRKVEIADKSICAVVPAGASQLQLIGTRDGVTKLAVWTVATDGSDQKAVYEIRVGAPLRNESNDPVKIAGTLTQTVKAAFPKSDVLVRYQPNQLIVEGNCHSDDSAKQILRMIRSACLLPVIDKLSIR